MNNYDDAEGRTSPTLDFVTILTAPTRLLTKQILVGTDGKPTFRDYDSAKHFDISITEVGSLDDFALVLDGLGAHSCIVHGKPIDGARRKRVRRLLQEDSETGDAPTIEAASHYWLPIDLDDVDCPPGLDPIAEPERAVDYVTSSVLPSEMRGVDCWWQLTSGAGFKPGIRLRLMFWCDRPLNGEELRWWLTPCQGADVSIYRGNQPIYVARPIFKGVIDPVRRRSGLRQAERRLVCPPSIELKPAVRSTIETAPQAMGVAATCTMLSRYGEGALLSATKAILDAPNKKQEATLTWQCFSIGRLAGAGRVPADLALKILLKAALAIPDHDARRRWDEKEIDKKVRAKFQQGMKNPRPNLDSGADHA